MSRPLRIEYPDTWYHVMNRGRRGEDIFSTDGDYDLFVPLLRESAQVHLIRSNPGGRGKITQGNSSFFLLSEQMKFYDKVNFFIYRIY